MKLIKKEVFKHKNRNKLIINSLPNDITEEEENVLFDEKFVQIKSNKITERVEKNSQWIKMGWEQKGKLSCEGAAEEYLWVWLLLRI